MSEEAGQMFLAKALYDNIAESPDELAFRRGDVLTVMQQDTSGLDGWWLCSLRGRQGIAPGNRLKILSGMGGTVPGPQSEQDIARNEWRRSAETSPNKGYYNGGTYYVNGNVVTPMKKGDVYLYGQPSRSLEDYDVPPSRYFPSSKESSPELGSALYDTPNNRPSLPSNSLYDTPPSSKRASCERSPPGSNRTSLDSMTSSSGQLHRLSSENVYQTPPGSKRSSADSSSTSTGTMQTLHFSSGVESHYETPPGSKRASMDRMLSDDQPTYDTPPSQTRSLELLSCASYDMPSSRRQSRDSTGMSSRASLLSTASSESSLSNSSSQLTTSRHSNTASLVDSARSSLDASLHDMYDLPPRDARALKQLSMDSGLGLYDTPSGRNRTVSPQPPHLAASSSHLSDFQNERMQRPPPDMKRSRSLEHALDDLYDSPSNNAPKIGLKSSLPAFGSSSAVNHDPSAVYDIPPQVTRDSIISARSDSSDDSLRLSSCSIDSRGSIAEGVYEELLLDLDSALELLMKLQQDVTKATARLLAFVSSTWRSKESLQSRIYEIKVACFDVKKTLKEFVDFAQGTLANSVRLPDKKLVNRLVKHVTPLQHQYQSMSASLRSLEDMKWQVSLLTEPINSDAPDDLESIIALVKDLGPDVKKLASLIQGNSSLLFKRSSDLGAHSRGAGSEAELVAAKPPIRPKPEVAQKSGAILGGSSTTGVGSTAGRGKAIQQRPLPALPFTKPERPLTTKSFELGGSVDNLSQAFKNISVTSSQRDNEDRDYSDLAQEYDYVQLETCDVVAQQQRKDQQQNVQQIKEQHEVNQLPVKGFHPNQSQANTHHQGTNGDERHYIDENQKLSEDQSPSTTKGEIILEEDRTKADKSPDLHIKQHYTETVSADHGDKMHDVDMVPIKETSSMIDGSMARANKDISAKETNDSVIASLTPFIEEDQDLKTPVNTNGFMIPGPHSHHNSSMDFTGTTLDPNDKQVLVYYSGQLETHSTLLTNAIDAFFTCIENNEPPKVFISNSKFVIVTAHKLVYISDALHRSLMHNEVRNKVMHCANHMCECLKISVQATKTAALQYPSVPAVQEMVDRVVDVSHAAHELKLVITQASAL